MSFQSCFRIRYVAALAVAAGCAGHPPVELPARATAAEPARAASPSKKSEPESCIPRKVTEEIRCAGRTRRPERRPVAPTAPPASGRVVRRRPVALAPEQEWVAPAPAGAAAAVAERRLRAAVAEQQRQLAAASRAGRPRLLRDLADAHAELANKAFRRKVASEIRAANRKQPRRMAADQALAAQADRDMRRARDQAIAYGEQLLRHHPRWCAGPTGALPNRRCADELLYFLSYQHGPQGSHAAALRLSRELIARFPRPDTRPTLISR